MARRRSGHEGHHGGAWKVAYADFVTAMMAFFIVMWVLGMDTKTQQAIASYFNNPAAKGQPSAGGVPVGQMPGAGDKMMIVNVPTAARDATLGTMQGSVEQALATVPEFADLRDAIEMHVDADGLHIELVEREDDMFFEKGKATLTQRAVTILQAIARVLYKFPNQIVIEGHTDSLTYESGDENYSNWELSADRANAARRVVEPLLQANQFAEVRAYADRVPRTALDPSNPTNRRVSILVRPLISAQAPPMREAPPSSPSMPSSTDLFPEGVGAPESAESAESAAETGWGWGDRLEMQAAP